MRQAKPCVFRKIDDNDVWLILSVDVDEVIVFGNQRVCDFFDQLKQNFPVKDRGELNIYTGCALEHDWDNGILEMNEAILRKT